MAGYKKFDPRLESLVVETRTIWPSGVGASLTEAERKKVSEAVQGAPAAVAQLSYERTHTGFIREITVTDADIERLIPSGRFAGKDQ